MTQDLKRIAALCRAYLDNYRWASWQERTMEIVKELHEATAPEEAPPTLGVQVSDGLAMREKVGG